MDRNVVNNPQKIPDDIREFFAMYIYGVKKEGK